MNFELFITRKMIGARAAGQTSGGTRAIIRIAIIGIALGMAVMILSTAIVSGFQTEIRDKVIGFGSHIQITNYNITSSLESNPISIEQPFYPGLNNVSGVANIQIYATKAGIIKTDDEIEGVLVKGIGEDFSWAFFDKNMVEGESFRVDPEKRSKEMVVSKKIADKLSLEVGDKLLLIFVSGGQERKRQFTLSGIYETGLEQFDRRVVLADIKHVQRLNGFDSDQISGFEVLIDSYENLDLMDEIISDNIGFELNTSKITDLYGDIFGWLGLQDINVIIIISLMILVSGINMSSALLIIILERTRMIGILKALGSSDWTVRKVFLYNAAYLTTIGLVLGNVLGLGLCIIQDQFGILTLPADMYYISQVPIRFEPITLIAINLGTLVLCVAMLVLPTLAVTKITPVQAIQFD